MAPPRRQLSEMTPEPQRSDHTRTTFLSSSGRARGWRDLAVSGAIADVLVRRVALDHVRRRLRRLLPSRQRALVDVPARSVSRHVRARRAAVVPAVPRAGDRPPPRSQSPAHTCSCAGGSVASPPRCWRFRCCSRSRGGESLLGISDRIRRVSGVRSLGAGAGRAAEAVRDSRSARDC